MTTNSADATVIELASHPVWRASRRHSLELANAMRRHPSSYRFEEDVVATGIEASHPAGSNPASNGDVLRLAWGRAARPVAAVAES